MKSTMVSFLVTVREYGYVLWWKVISLFAGGRPVRPVSPVTKEPPSCLPHLLVYFGHRSEKPCALMYSQLKNPHSNQHNNEDSVSLSQCTLHFLRQSSKLQFPKVNWMKMSPFSQTWHRESWGRGKNECTLYHNNNRKTVSGLWQCSIFWTYTQVTSSTLLPTCSGGSG